ncbi:MAG: MFS transporter [Deltaproteobacteria bacterium]|nr:MFS transporter [Deltaproteobacteria bacterium]
MHQQTRFWGELTAFLALFLDNIGVFVFFSGILVFTFNYPMEIILNQMVPGTALGVLFGDLVYTYMAYRLGKSTGRKDVTAMPLGLDTPSSIGLAFAVIGPAYVATKDPILTWQIGMATLFLIGVVKVITAFFGSRIQRIIPTAGLLGSIAGIGLVLLAFLPLVEIFNEIVVGMVALGLIFSALLGRMALPGRIPGVLAAVILGAGIHFALGYAGLLPEFQKPTLTFALCIPSFSYEFLETLPKCVKYLPIAIPFGLMTIIGGINNTESARLAGDNYKTRNILLTEALTSLIAAFFGGVIQTTPYIGHPAYKKMGATYWYTLATGLLIGLGAVIGLLSIFLALIPRAVLAPIFLFIGFEIVRQAYRESPASHSPAVSFSFLPVIANLVMIILTQFLSVTAMTPEGFPMRLQILHQSLTVLSNGFVLTAMLWGSMVALIIDRKPHAAATYALCCGFLTLFGLMHSVVPSGEIYLPWSAPNHTHFWMAGAYVLLGCVLFMQRGVLDNAYDKGNRHVD